MAAGGTWTSQNKVRPGAYININSNSLLATANDSDRGVIFWVHSGSFGWGADGVTEITGNENLTSLFGADPTSADLAPLREILKANPRKVLVFNSNAGVKASGKSAVLPWNITAKYAGEKGNSVSVVAFRDATDPTKVDVVTYFGTQLVNSQSVAKASELLSNSYVDFAITDAAKADDGAALISAIASTITVQLSGGTTVVSDDVLADINRAASTLDYNVITAAGADVDAAIHLMIYNIVHQLRENEGLKVLGVIPTTDNLDCDYPGIIDVKNGVVLKDGTVLEPTLAMGYVAGATAVADINESLTGNVYPGAVDVFPRYTNAEIITALKAGEFVFTARRDGAVVIEQDVNSHHTFTVELNQYFRKNRVIRTLDAVANDLKAMFDSQFSGKINNDLAGQNVFKASCITYLAGIEAKGAVQNFVPDDIVVANGDDKDAILVNLAIQPTDSMEKLYMQIAVQ